MFSFIIILYLVIKDNDPRKLYTYISQRLRSNHYEISTVRPMWVRRVLEAVARNMLENKCDIIIYGNDRGANAGVCVIMTMRMTICICILMSKYYHILSCLGMINE